MKLTVSNWLIIISLIFTWYSYLNPEIIMYWMNSFFLERWDYLSFFYQIVVHNFIHWWFMHLAFNSIFLYIFWNQIEEYLSKKTYIIFFIWSVVFNTIFLLLLTTNTTTVWISWFAMALLSFYTLKLKEIWNPDYKWWITWIVLNILIGFSDKISLVWHLFWAIYWVIFFYILKFINKNE